MSNLLATIVVPEFITKIPISKKQRARYYKQTKGRWKPRQLPPTYKKKLREGIYSQNKKGYLLDENGERKLANPRSVGNPKYLIFSGNDLLSGYGSPHTRAKITRALKDFYRPFVQEIVRKQGPITTFPLRVTWDLYTTVEDEPNWDVFNLFFYYKYFEDSLHEKTTKDNLIRYKGENLRQLIPDDNVKYITWPPGPKLIPVDKWKDRKFIFRLYHDNRTELRRPPWN